MSAWGLNHDWIVSEWCLKHVRMTSCCHFDVVVLFVLLFFILRGLFYVFQCLRLFEDIQKNMFSFDITLFWRFSVKLFSHYAFWHAKLFFFSEWCFAIVSPFLFHQTQSWLVIAVHLSVIRLWPLGDGFATWFSHGSGTHSQRIRSDTKTIGWSPFEWFSSTRRDCVSMFHMFPYALFCFNIYQNHRCVAVVILQYFIFVAFNLS